MAVMTNKRLVMQLKHLHHDEKVEYLQVGMGIENQFQIVHTSELYASELIDSCYGYPGAEQWNSSMQTVQPPDCLQRHTLKLSSAILKFIFKNSSSHKHV